MAFEKLKRDQPVNDTVESEVVDSTEEKIKPKVSNRRKFVKAFYVIAFLWFVVVLFALGGIWAPPTLYGLATNFTATAWLIGLPNVFATVILLFCAQEFMDVE